MIKKRTTKESIEVIRDLISPFYEGTRVYDRDIAITLGISTSKLSVSKNRDGKIYKPILDFCIRTGNNPMEIFYKVIEE